MKLFKTKLFYIGSLLFISSFLLPSYGSKDGYLYGFQCADWAIAILRYGDNSFCNIYVGVMGMTNFVFIFYPVASILFKSYVFYYSILMVISSLWVIGYLFMIDNFGLHLTTGYYCWLLSYIVMSFGAIFPEQKLIQKRRINYLITIILVASVLFFLFSIVYFAINFNLKYLYHNSEDAFLTKKKCIQYLNMSNQKIQPPAEQSNIYISHLSFMDPSNGSSLFHNEIGKLINGAVINGIHNAQKVNPRIKYNAEDHKLEDTDTRVYKLVEITFDNILTRNEKISKIIKEIMEPANIDVIVTGLYIDKGSVVDIRPLIIVKYEQKIVTKLATFEKKDFLCSDPYNPSSTFLCKKSCDKISELVEELLAAL